MLQLLGSLLCRCSVWSHACTAPALFRTLQGCGGGAGAERQQRHPVDHRPRAAGRSARCIPLVAHGAMCSRDCCATFYNAWQQAAGETQTLRTHRCTRTVCLPRCAAGTVTPVSGSSSNETAPALGPGLIYLNGTVQVRVPMVPGKPRNFRDTLRFPGLQVTLPTVGCGTCASCVTGLLGGAVWHIAAATHPGPSRGQTLWAKGCTNTPRAARRTRCLWLLQDGRGVNGTATLVRSLGADGAQLTNATTPLEGGFRCWGSELEERSRV